MSTVKTYLLNGDELHVDLTGADTIGDVREAIAETLGEHPHFIRLLCGAAALDDSQAFSCLPASSSIVVTMVSPGPEWYPARKYMHDSKEVLKVTWKMWHNRGHEWHGYEIVYTDDSTAKQSDQGCVRDDGVEERLADIFKFAGDLAEQLGFIRHCTSDYSDQPCMGVSYEAVPPEDPDEWEYFSDGWAETGEKRKPKSATTCPETSGNRRSVRQADGMPGVAFRLGNWQSEPCLNIPNDTDIACLSVDANWVAIDYQGMLGYVKRRNVIDADNLTLPEPQRVIAAQADGHAGVALHVGEWHRQAQVDIPNGSEICCLFSQHLGGDEWLAVQWRDMLGFVKERNTFRPPTCGE